jgi:hypothetical protein
MIRLHPHFFIGLFALLTLILAGAAIGRLLGLSSGEGAYLLLLILAFIAWVVSRRMFRKES